MTERELLLTGIGGQGVQLAAQILARGATLEGRKVSLFGVYGGMMRGGNSDSTLVVADGPIESPPLVARAWSAIVMHHMYWPPLAARMRPGGVVVLNSSLFEGSVDRDDLTVFDIPASDLAAEMGTAMAASMVITGAYATITGLVGIDALIEGMRQSLPSYRRQHSAANEQALRAGMAAAPAMAAPAWTGSPQALAG